MNILIKGEADHAQECKEKFGASHQYSWVAEHRDAEKFLQYNELVFDFIIEEEPHQFEIYCSQRTTVFLNTCKIKLAELIHLLDRQVASMLFGFNGMPTFLAREIMEVSCWRKDDERLEKNMRSIGDGFSRGRGSFRICDAPRSLYDHQQSLLYGIGGRCDKR